MPQIGGQPPHLFTRATIYDPKTTLISNVDRIKYPPLKFNTKYQRASTPAKPMFYATWNKSTDKLDIYSAIKTCLLETITDYSKLVNNGMKVLISLWYNSSDLRLYSVFNSDEFQENNDQMKSTNKAFNNAVKEFDDQLFKDTTKFLDYLAKIYSDPTNDEHFYKPSAVITQYLMPKLQKANLDGVIFPSVKIKGRELNVAITPDSFDEKIHLSKFLDCRFMENGKLRIEIKGEHSDLNNKLIYNEYVSEELDVNLLKS